MPITKEMGTDADLVENTPRLNSRDSAALKDIMKKRLTECGWRKDIEQMIRQTIQEHGVGTLTSDQLAEKIVPHARALVPDVICKEMMIRVHNALGSSQPAEKK